MKNPKPIICPECKRERLVDYRHLWLIKKGRISDRCFSCSRFTKGQVNSGSFKRGVIPVAPFLKGHSPWNKGLKGWSKRARLPEEIRKERKREQDRIYRAKNREQLNEKQRNYGKKNSANRNAYVRFKYKNDVNFRLRMALRRRFRKAFKGNFKTGSFVKDLGCSIADLKVYFERQFQPGMTWSNWGPRGWHIDHKVPLGSFDLSEREQFLKACHYSNLQPLWAIENIRKSDHVGGK